MRSNGFRYLLMTVGWMALSLGGCVVGEGDTTREDELARASLQMLPGCYTVRYEFVEDSAHRFFLDGNTEYIDLVPQGDGLVARNFLILDEDNAFLHWRQEWQPLGNGRWRMRVTDGAGNERYTSQGAWRFNQWEGEPAIAVKPTRDGERDDYAKLLRRNIFQFTTGRWVQSEANVKQLANGMPVASEVGWIVYERLPSDEACAPAMELASRTGPVLMARAAPRLLGW